jgi:hypothetical protein
MFQNLTSQFTLPLENLVSIELGRPKTLSQLSYSLLAQFDEWEWASLKTCETTIQLVSHDLTDILKLCNFIDQ